jgi:hypothetical protein
MRTFAKSALLIGVLTVAFSGCSPLSSAFPTTTTPLAIANQSGGHRQSWMLAEASGEDLLYIADYLAGGILVYSYAPPKYGLVGVLSPPNTYSHLCVNSEQDVFATQFYSVVEYKHGATSPFRILGGLQSEVYGCSVDSTTGTLAVANGNGSTRVPTAYISFFKRSGGRHTTLSLPEPYRNSQGIAYDASGNLFVTGYVPGNPPTFVLLELPKGGKQFVEVKVGKTFVGNGQIAWDGKYLDFADPRKNVIYRFAIDGQRLKPKDTISLQRSYGIGGFFVEGAALIVPAASKPSYSDPGQYLVNFYNYPAGGRKTGVIRGVSEPTGAVVSLGQTAK